MDNLNAENEITNGMNMGKLNDFVFYMGINEYKKITDTITANFKEVDLNNGIERLYGRPVNKRTINLNGVLVVQPLDALKSL